MKPSIEVYISEKNKTIHRDAEKIRPNYMSLSELIWLAVEQYTKSHSNKDGELTPLDVPLITDDWKQFLRYFKSLKYLQLQDIREKLHHLDNLLEHEQLKR